MISGIGTDIVDVQRIAKSIENGAFIARVFSIDEITYCDSKVNKAESYAARFAAKEAFVKALGTGLRGGIALKEIEILNDEIGRPFLQLTGETKEILAGRNIKQIHVSLSHIKETAVAMIIVEC